MEHYRLLDEGVYREVHPTSYGCLSCEIPARESYGS